MDRKQILVIDDSQFLCTLMKKSFEALGFDVRAAHTMESGIKALEALAPDLILLDINLPDATGTEACIVLKQEPAYRDIPIFLISGSNEEFLRQKVAETGANGYIKKPISPSSILRWVKENSHRIFKKKADAPSSTVVTPVAPLQPIAPVVQGAAETTPAQAPAAAAQPAEVFPAPIPGQRTIVITDDSKFLCSILRDTLEKAGFNVYTFSTIRETGFFLRDHTVDLAFIDINLPDVPGDRACQIIKSSPKTANLPIILISGSEESVIRQKVSTCGANGFLSKPFTPVNVLEWIQANALALFGEAIAFLQPEPVEDTIHFAESEEAARRQATLENSRQVQILLEQLDSANRAVQVDACYSLGELKVKKAVEPLIVLLYDSDDDIKAEAAWALGEIGDVDAVPLMSLLAIQNQWLRERAVEALGKIGDRVAVDPLVKMLYMGDRDLRILALKALGKIGDPAAVPALEEICQKFSDEEILANAHWALRNIDQMNV